MNKYENAIDVVARYCSDVKSGVTPRMILTNELDILMKLVEKATPKKVNRVKTKSYDTYEVKIYGYCPVCDSDVFFDYCPHCGQALDWRKDDVD